MMMMMVMMMMKMVTVMMLRVMLTMRMTMIQIARVLAGAHEAGHILEIWRNLVAAGHMRRGTYWRYGEIWSPQGR